MITILCILGFAWLPVWVVELNVLLHLLWIMYFFVAFLCWRKNRYGFVLATALAFIGLFAVLIFAVLNVLGLYNQILVGSALLSYALLQIPLAYAGLRAYKGPRGWPIILVFIGSLILSSSYIHNATASYLAPSIDISHPQLTTLSQILNGTFRSALDKYGANGTVVEVVNVTVVQVFGAFDGDWHIVVSDPPSVKGPFITEVIPRDQARLHAPTPGSRITMIGVVYWDDAHVDEPWHGYMGWEIHPVLAWYAIS